MNDRDREPPGEPPEEPPEDVIVAAEAEAADEPPPARTPGDYAPSVAARLAILERAGGIVTPFLTAIVAFLVGGVVVLLTTGKNPLSTYKAIFDGTGLNYLWASDRFLAGLNLQQTLILAVPLILTGLAVAFAFRCGLFNIGGQGQYTVGAIVAVIFASEVTSLPRWPLIVVTVVLAMLGGAVWAGIAGMLKATVGAHEVITTIMLNWIALWIGSWFFGVGGPLQNPEQIATPVSKDVVDKAKLPVFWGDPLLQGLHIGFFVAVAGLVVFWILLNRTTLGYQVRAVGFNPEAARYGGISVARNYFLAMAIAGAFAGLAGALDILGWQFRLGAGDIQASQIGFIGIAVALLGRNTAVGVFLSSILFAALLNGTSTRNLDPSVFKPELATNLTLIIQGLVVLFVGADLIILYLWQLRRRVRRRRPSEARA
jgi:simple sugar transport system permease protein